MSSRLMLVQESDRADREASANIGLGVTLNRSHWQRCSFRALTAVGSRFVAPAAREIAGVANRPLDVAGEQKASNVEAPAK